MKTLALLSLSLAVALGAPPFAPDVAQKPVLTEENRSPLIVDLVPVQGHVVVEDPLPQVRIGSKEQEEKQAPVPVDTKQSQTMAEQEVKVRPQVGVEQEGEVKTEGKKEPEVKAEQEVNVKPAMEPESDVKVELDVQEETEPEVKSTVNEEEREVQEEPLVQDGEPIMELEPEVREEPFLRQQIRPEFHVQMDLEAETETGQELEERHIDMERKHEVVAEPIMKLEPLDDDDMFREEVSNMELSEEKPLRVAFESVDPLPEEGGLMRQRKNVLAGEPIMELEPEVREEPFLRQQIRPEFHVQMDLEEETETGQELEERHIDMERKHEMVAEPIMELEPLDDDDDDHMFREEVSNTEQGLMRKRDHVLDEEPIMQLEPEVREEHQMPPSEQYFPNEEARMRIRMERRKQKQRLNYLMMEEPGSEFVWGEESSSVMDGPVFVRQEVKTPVEGEGSPATWQSYRSCVTHEGKCYQFFKGPKSAPEAEFFCQEHFSGGHLASITSPNIHRELMNMMLAQNGAYTRSWIGGLRYLETGRFIWLDGSQWSYADWLSGEPNNTADMQDCVEVLALGNGKFNDFTCRERQAFICSYPYQ